MSIAQFIDHTVLKPTTTLAEIETLCEEGVHYGFASVCIPPYFVNDAASILKGQQLKVCTVVGFPFGYSHFSAKLAETAIALSDGAREIDMVLNLAAFRSNDIAYLETEIQKMCNLVKGEGAVLKLIIESGILTEDEIIRCCEIFGHYPIDYMKTSTGYAEKGASVEAVRIMRQHLPPAMGIKASGGIRTYAFAKELVDAGATRLGCSASVAIVKGAGADDGGY